MTFIYMWCCCIFTPLHCEDYSKDYEDDDGNWRNEYDDEGYEFAEPEAASDQAKAAEVNYIEFQCCLPGFLFYSQKISLL